MASTACAADDRCVHPADHTDEGLWTSCHVCGKFFHMKCRPKRHTVGLGDPAADDCMRAGAAVFHCPGECLDKAKEDMSRIRQDLIAALPAVMSKNLDLENQAYFESALSHREYLIGGRVPADVAQLIEKLEEGDIPTIGHYSFAVEEMNRMLKKHLKPSERGKANKLQADLKRLLKKDAAEGAESAPAADMELPRCSRCENLLLEELQGCDVGHIICRRCRGNRACCPLCLPGRRRRLKPTQMLREVQQGQELDAQLVQPPQGSGIPASDLDEETVMPERAKKPRRGRPPGSGKKKPPSSSSSSVQAAANAAQRRPAAAAPPREETRRESQEVEGMLGYLLEEDHEPLRPLNLPRDDQCSIDNRVRDEFYNVLGGLDDDDDLQESDACSTTPDEQQPPREEGEPPKQSASQSETESADDQEEPVGEESEEHDEREPIQLLKTADGKILFRGYRRGKNLVQMPDGKHVIYSPSADPDCAAKLPIAPNALVTPLRVGDVAAGSFTPVVASRTPPNTNRTSSSTKATKNRNVTNGTPEDGGGHLVMPVPPRVRTSF